MMKYLFAVLLFIGCANGTYDYEKTYNQATSIEMEFCKKDGIDAVTRSLSYSSSRVNLNLSLRLIEEKLPLKNEAELLDYLSNLKMDKYLIDYSLKKTKRMYLRLYAMNLLFKNKMLSNLPPSYAFFTYKMLTTHEVKKLFDDGIELYNDIPYTNSAFITLIKSRFLASQRTIEAISSSRYLLKNNALSNEEIIDKHKKLKSPNSFILLNDIITNKPDQMAFNYLIALIKKTDDQIKDIRIKIMAFIKIDEFSMSSISAYPLFKKLNVNKPHDRWLKNMIARFTLTAGKGKGLHVREYLRYLLRQCMYQIDNNPIDNDKKLIFYLLKSEKRFPEITKIVHSYFQRGNDQDVIRLLMNRRLRMAEIPLVDKYLRSKNPALKFYSAISISKAYEEEYGDNFKLFNVAGNKLVLPASHSVKINADTQSGSIKLLGPPVSYVFAWHQQDYPDRKFWNQVYDVLYQRLLKSFPANVKISLIVKNDVFKISDHHAYYAKYDINDNGKRIGTSYIVYWWCDKNKRLMTFFVGGDTKRSTSIFMKFKQSCECHANIVNYPAVRVPQLHSKDFKLIEAKPDTKYYASQSMRVLTIKKINKTNILSITDDEAKMVFIKDIKIFSYTNVSFLRLQKINGLTPFVIIRGEGYFNSNKLYMNMVFFIRNNYTYPFYLFSYSDVSIEIIKSFIPLIY